VADQVGQPVSEPVRVGEDNTEETLTFYGLPLPITST